MGVPIVDIEYRDGVEISRRVVEEGSPEWLARQPRPRVLTKFGFISLFTPEEQAAALALKGSTLALFWLNYEAANSFERDHPATLAGLAALETVNVLTAERKAEIVETWPVE